MRHIILFSVAIVLATSVARVARSRDDTTQSMRPNIVLAKGGGGHAVLLDWPYKLHTNPGKKGRNEKEDLSTVLLYDVSKDPVETTDLVSQESDRVAKMTAALETWKGSVKKSLEGSDYISNAK